MSQKYYTVFAGRNPGVYDSWDEARINVENFPGARYKGYSSMEEAVRAYRGANVSEEKEIGNLLSEASQRIRQNQGEPSYLSNPEVDLDGWAVDASCLGNPGKMEYRGVELKTGKTIFRSGPYEDATNNVGEFLAIVHALALMQQKGEWHTIYSDSISGMAWVRTKKVKTKLTPTPRNAKVFELLARAVTWLNTHSWPCRILKWQTERWGEIPADFGRK